MNKQQIRQQIRKQRLSLSPAQQQQAASRLAFHLCRSPLLKNKQHIALYLANDGELSLSPLIKMLRARGKNLYLPLVTNFKQGQMKFVRYQNDTRLRRNRFGIQEPAPTKEKDQSGKLELVLTPLVAFDRQGYRLGMGGGFYDRAFARNKREKQKIRLVGIAHQLQRLEKLPVESWDVPMQAIVTDQGLQ